MGFQVTLPTLLSIFALLVTPSTSNLDTQFKNGLDNFSQNLFQKLLESHSQENVILSPFSIQCCMSMVRLGADDETAKELDQALGFQQQSIDLVADNYFNLLSQYENSTIMQVANKVYIMETFELNDTFNDVLSHKYFSSAEGINFGQNTQAADTINNWVQTKTNHLIKDLISPSVLNSNTRLLLLNAIYFKGQWVKAFNEAYTKETDFFTTETNAVKVQMMNNVDFFEVAWLPVLEATIVRLPYQDSDISMLIILPDNRTGLAKMAVELKDIKLESITENMHNAPVKLSIPKFKAEFRIDLTKILSKVGLSHTMNGGSFDKMLKHPTSLAISAAVHKAFIEVNEAGTEAGASTDFIMSTRSGPAEFNADHPFYYAIVNAENVVLFQGTVVNF